MLTDEQIKKFQALYKERFGVEIGEAEAREQGDRLVRLINLITRPGTQSGGDAKTSKNNHPHEAQI
jgi:hypothetical protein